MTSPSRRFGTTQIGTEPRRAQRRPWRRLLAAAMAAGVVALGLSTAQAGATAGTVPEVRLASDAAGALTISWDSPADAPSDYRVMWAEATQDYLSWKADNETTRGNSYPEGTATSLTLTGLTEGAEYKVRVRSRYRSGGPNGPWSGPWTDEATLQVSSTQAADPAPDKRGDPQRGARDEPLLDPPQIISDDEDDENLQFAEQSDSSAVTLLSNLGHSRQSSSSAIFNTLNALVDQSFTTGGSSDTRYVLTSLTLSIKTDVFVSDTLGVAVYTDAGGVPGTLLYAYDPQELNYRFFTDATFVGEVPLEPNTKYWLRVSTHGSSIGQVKTVSSGLVDSDGLSDWSLGDTYHISTAASFGAAGTKALAVSLRGQVLDPSPVEPAGGDFAADSSTLGRLEVGTLSSGTLSDRADRDLFKLEDLPATVNTARDGQANSWSRKRYRVQAWFGDHAPGAEQGGEIFIMEAPSGSGSLYSAVSDTNEDGLSFFEFEAFPNIDYYVMVVPTAAVQVFKTGVAGVFGESYELENRTYTGAYKLKIDDVSHIEEMADTLHETAPSSPSTRVRVTTGTTNSTVALGARREGLDRTVAFRTGSDSRGYVLNRIEAAVSGTEVSAFAVNAKVSIYADGTGGMPGTELFTLKTPADVWGPATSFDDYEESFWVPTGNTAVNLTHNTWYWVVFAMKTGATAGSYSLDLVDGATDDAKAGWRIHPDARTRSRTIASDPWTLFADDATNRSIQIGVYASPNTGTGHKNPVPLDTAPES